jgi:hypothetical protein
MIRGSDILRGALIYPLGDALAMWIHGPFVWTRVLGLALVGGTLYAWEVGAAFRWIDRRVPHDGSRAAGLRRALMAVAYFNPLWIARHMLFLKVFAGQGAAVTWSLLATGTRSFVVNIPLALLGNYAIQNAVPRGARFAASAAFSGFLAVYYALSAVWFE